MLIKHEIINFSNRHVAARRRRRVCVSACARLAGEKEELQAICSALLYSAWRREAAASLKEEREANSLLPPIGIIWKLNSFKEKLFWEIKITWNKVYFCLTKFIEIRPLGFANQQIWYPHFRRRRRHVCLRKQQQLITWEGRGRRIPYCHPLILVISEGVSNKNVLNKVK